MEQHPRPKTNDRQSEYLQQPGWEREMSPPAQSEEDVSGGDPKRIQKLEAPSPRGSSRQEPLSAHREGHQPEESAHREEHQLEEVAKRTSSDRRKMKPRGSHATKEPAKEPPKRATKPLMPAHEKTPHLMDEQTPQQMGKSDRDLG